MVARWLLELTDIGFHHSVLSEFRTRLVTGQAEGLIFEQLLTLCQSKGCELSV